ncbi:MAG TPA: crossover junction endodeoxyribonuclease RuvC [Saprospiraceae bacterium]|nr:crossover junction endodeoxyribonuclease RuvC [Saprospiraceae bacterium]
MGDNYRILGVDPGTNLLGYAVLEVEGIQLKIITMGVLKLTTFETHQDKLKEIYLQLQEIVETYMPVCMAIEAPFYGKNVQSMLKLGRAQGVAIAAAITMGLDIAEYSPKKIKQSVTGNGNASKEQVSSMLNTLLKIEIKEKYLDATDALAAAICHYHQKGKKRLSGSTHSWASFVKQNPGRIR